LALSLCQRVHPPCGRGCTYDYFLFRRIEFIDSGKEAKEAPIESLIMTQATDFDAWSVVHELGHAWDDNFSHWLSAQLKTKTGGYTFPAGSGRWRRLLIIRQIKSETFIGSH
jgi:hypothetical protein